MYKVIKILLILGVVFSLCLVSYIFGYTNSQKLQISGSTIEQSINEDELFGVVNEYKEKESGYRYITDERLCQQASMRAKQIKSDWSHDGFNQVPLFDFHRLGENIARDYVDVNLLLADWLDSPSHRANLEDNFTHSCIRCEQTHCVQLFASY